MKNKQQLTHAQVTSHTSSVVKCGTCHEAYSEQITVCSNSFHCCKDCVWYQGQRLAMCNLHWVDAFLVGKNLES